MSRKGTKKTQDKLSAKKAAVLGTDELLENLYDATIHYVDRQKRADFSTHLRH